MRAPSGRIEIAIASQLTPKGGPPAERRFASLADNEQVLADDHNSAVHRSNHDQSCGPALAVEE
jgi:hypothetical protein